ncbi:30S ribosomal protein S16 [Turneriella parva]|jgi:small subunit ribosomal protein S16|uniref:Small ribosomal subunit protein bS16 n=1 Tax=Turneriella parva (strain ATCC BAA-1111 / DSM 21527 / NCTC 11395 / H) TaxID=869212 RepID=I4B657_TURPD|nr:30S ribosomal protein S16 [Turneriella parva]AFM12764.1 SSU ribosomal protein S16P [Turneriella parva DSM 21527]
MTVKLRLQRYGTKKRPFYRIVATSSSVKRDGKFLEIVGLYHPLVKEGGQVRLEKEKIQTWLSKGAQPSDTVKTLLSKAGIWKPFAEAKAIKDGAKQKRLNEKAKAKRAAK